MVLTALLTLRAKASLECGRDLSRGHRWPASRKVSRGGHLIQRHQRHWTVDLKPGTAVLSLRCHMGMVTTRPISPQVQYRELDELLAGGHKIPPLSREVLIRFGSTSNTFSQSRQALRAAFELVKDSSEVNVKYQEWNVLLAKVYGSSPEDVDLFIKHTYLTMVSRAVVTLALYREARRDTALYRGLMSGEFFRDRNIQNLAEADFFSWGYGNSSEAVFFEVFANLFRRLAEFEWSRLDEDLLKMLYQELVDPDDRQLLGEFYTPDWLAELTLEQLGYKGGTLLDPACGSGTFLFCAIRKLRASGLKGNELIKTALDSIVGIDVHPVAALMARANILLALAAELPQYPHDVYLRVYLADTLMTGEDTRFLRRQKVDFIVANPPWLSLRDVKDAGYRAKIKELAFDYGLVERTERKLFTQIDTATVFFAHAEHKFLRPGGGMGFVMPKSVVLPAKQHFAFQKTGFTAIHDFGGVQQLFKVPTCVLIRNPYAATEGIPITLWSGDISPGERNLPWAQVREVLKSAAGTWSFPSSGPAQSLYYPHVLQGATLVPRSLWFVEPPTDRPVNLSSPFVHTARAIKAAAKEPWKRIEMRGRVEKEFLFGSVLAEDLLPFAVRRLRLVVLPLLERQGRFVLLNSLEILGEGGLAASGWMEAAEKIWEKRKKTDQPSIHEYINYDQKITNQDPSAQFVVLYNRSGTNIAAAYLTPAEHRHASQVPIRGFVADNVTYRYYADSEDHALYLVGVLNSSVVNEAIKPYQSQGLQGERDIHRRPFEVCPIPLFSRKESLHREIVRMARVARRKMLDWGPGIEGNAAQARQAARQVVQPELDKLDELVSELLKNPSVAQAKVRKNGETLSLFANVEHA
jgi:hypothetical protein